MQKSAYVHLRPEDILRDVIKTQKTIRITRLDELLAPVVQKLTWQDQALLNNVKTIRKLNDRAQRAEQKLKNAEKRIEEYEHKYWYENI